MYSQPVRDENGESVIPASQRPDGTWRKARRVKEGYVPQEEVPLYESKGKQYLNRISKAPDPLPSGHVPHQTIPGLFILVDKDKDKDKTKTKKKQKNSVHEVGQSLEKIKLTEKTKTSEKSKTSEKTKSTEKKKDNTQSKLDATTDNAKRLKNLKKRLREVEALEEKLKEGLIAKPEPDQLAKVKRKSDLIMEIHELEKLVA